MYHQSLNISLAFLHWVGMALHPWPFVSDIAIFVLKGDGKLQLTNRQSLTSYGIIKCWWSLCRCTQSGADLPRDRRQMHRRPALLVRDLSLRHRLTPLPDEVATDISQVVAYLQLLIWRQRFQLYRIRTDPGRSWNFIVQNFKPWRVLEKGIGPGKSWKVLEL